MQRLAVLAILLWGGEMCLAQDRGAIQGVYLRMQGFDFNSGSPEFNIQNAHIDGGGYAIVTNITQNFGIFQQMGFLGNVEQNGIKVRLTTEFQGMQVRTISGPLILYAKGGLGFTRYIFSEALSGAYYGFAMNYGGGAEIRVTKGLFLVLEATRLTMSLPNLTNAPDRSGWDSAWQFATGLAIHW